MQKLCLASAMATSTPRFLVDNTPKYGRKAERCFCTRLRQCYGVDPDPLGWQIFIKDVKSSNGTFVNGERLSVEGVESDPWELKSDDRVVRSSFRF